MQYYRNIQGLIVISTILLLHACKGNDHEVKEKIQPVIVTVSMPSVNRQDGIAVSGQIEAAQSVNISTRIMGTITNIYVKVGDHVRKGQTLATISSQDMLAKKAQASAAIAEAEANVKSIQKDYERFTNLFNKQSASAKELDNVTLQYNGAKARLDAAMQMRNEINAMMAYTVLSAPFDGTVTQKMADEGALTNPGMPVFTIEQNSQLQVSTTVSEAEISQIKKGDKAQADIKAIGKRIVCSVNEISPSSQFTGGRYKVTLSIPAGEMKDLYPGMYVNVFIPGKTPVQLNSNAILVPMASLVQADQLTGLYTISSNNTALLRWIRTGKISGDNIEVLSGLGSDEKFITSASGKLYNGVPVREKN